MKSLFTIAILFVLFTAPAYAGTPILLMLEDGNVLNMYCEDSIEKYESLDLVDALLLQPDWVFFDKTCGNFQTCSRWRGWLVGDTRCIEVYEPRRVI